MRHSALLQIHTDQGPQFEAILFQEIIRLFDINKTRSTPYHSQSAGQVERMNGILAQMLRTYVVTGDIKAHQVLLNRVPEQATEDCV